MLSFLLFSIWLFSWLFSRIKIAIVAELQEGLLTQHVKESDAYRHWFFCSVLPTDNSLFSSLTIDFENVGILHRRPTLSRINWTVAHASLTVAFSRFIHRWQKMHVVAYIQNQRHADERGQRLHSFFNKQRARERHRMRNETLAEPKNKNKDMNKLFSDRNRSESLQA